jgi:folate-binding protein YgfZ
MFSRDQYDAARTSAVMVDRSAQGKIAFAGSDRGSFLHALLTNDIMGLPPGTGVYAAYLTPQGRMISDMRVIEIGDRILLDVDASVAAPLAERFDKLIFSEDVQVRDVSHELTEIGVHGPSASDVIERATGITAKGLVKQYNNIMKDRWGSTPSSGPIIVVRDDSLGLTGFDIYVPWKDAGAVRQSLIGASAVEIGKDTTEVLRLEAGRPRFGADMDADTIPLEAGIEDRAISFTKGCYVGQEVIIRVLHRGHGRVARRLVGLVMIGGEVPAPGDVIAAGENVVGKITSAAQSPLIGSPIALGYVHRDYTAPGTELTVRPLGPAAVSARVHQIPFSR